MHGMGLPGAPTQYQHAALRVQPTLFLLLFVLLWFCLLQYEYASPMNRHEMLQQF